MCANKWTLEENAETEGEETGKKGGKKKLIILIVAAVLLLGIGAGAALFLLGGDDEPVEGEETATEASLETETIIAPAIYLPLEPAFVVDFMVDNKQRYLQLSLTVKSRNQVQIDALKVHLPLIRNSLVLLFASQDFAELQTAAGKLALKAAAIDAINGILTQETGSEGVEDVLFMNFVMQ